MNLFSKKYQGILSSMRTVLGNIRPGWLSLFVLGMIVGLSVKVEASKSMTIGFDDYRIEDQRQQFDFQAMSAHVAEQQQQAGQALGAQGASCGQ